MNPFEVPIVMYHSINNRPSANPLGCLSFYMDEFIAHLQFFKKEGFELVTLSSLLHESLNGGLDKKKRAALTFDDGFLDNYLIAANVLEKFRAKGTIFVNPDHVPSGPARSLNDVPDAWGNLNFEEMRILEKSGIYEIQSHTLSHDDVFVSDRLLDLYTPKKYEQYYWLIWKLFPWTKKHWQGDVSRYSELIPNGYPVFQYGRSLRGKQFIPSEDYIDYCVKQFRVRGERCFASLQAYPLKGSYETDDVYSQRVEEQIVQSKVILERELAKTVDCISFPGDVYSPPLLACAQSAGYKIFMRHPREKTDGNLAELQAAKGTLSKKRMIGLQRFVFNYDYRGLIPRKPAAYWTAKITVEGIQGNPLYSRGLSTARWLKRSVFKLGPISREQRCEQ